jgi:uncharacterized protein (TIGR00730 family)
MDNKRSELTARNFPTAEEDAIAAEPLARYAGPESAYRLAFTDIDFLLREELRPVRFQLELLKPEMVLEEARVGSTLVMYGSARIPTPQQAEVMKAGLEHLPEAERRVQESLIAKAKYYEEAYKLARKVSEKGIIEDGRRQFVVCSGGGPSIMEAANKGASDAGAESIGLNIVLPHEQAPNPYVTPYLALNFHYFALRKMHFLIRARAVAVFPGGFGTCDEMFELLTLIQTGKMKRVPIMLFGREFWNRIIDFEGLVEEGTIAARDLDLIHWCETADEAWEHVCDFYKLSDPIMGCD